MTEHLDAETKRVRDIWQRDVDRYERAIGFFERRLFKDGREWVCSRAREDTLEIAIGTGRNLPFYPPQVRLTGIDLSPATLALARDRARKVGREVDLREGDAQSLEFADASFDSVVCTLALCSIPNYRRAVAQVRRVLRPGGQFLLMEHTRSPIWIVRAGQRLLNPLSVRFSADHMLREPTDALRSEGFEILESERYGWGITERIAARRH